MLLKIILEGTVGGFLHTNSVALRHRLNFVHSNLSAQLAGEENTLADQHSLKRQPGGINSLGNLAAQISNPVCLIVHIIE